MRSNYVIIVITAIIVATVISLATYLHDIESKAMLKQFQDHQLLVARLTASKIQKFLDERSEGILAVSHLTNLQSKNNNWTKNSLDNYFLENKDNSIESANICDNSGTIVYSTNKNLIGSCYINTEVKTHLLKHEDKRPIYISSLPRTPQNISTSSLFKFVLATPIYKDDAHKKIFGILRVTVNLKDMLGNILKSVNIDSRRTNAWIMDEEGALIYSTDHPEMILNNIKSPQKQCFNCHNDFEYAKTIIKTDQGVINYKIKSQVQKIASYAPLQFENLSWHVVINTSLSEVTSITDRIYNIILVLLFIVIGTFVFGTLALLRNNIEKVKAIAESKRLQEKLVLEKKIEESERHYKSLVEFSPEAIVVHSEGKIVFINNSGLKLLGASSEDCILGRPILDFVHPDYRNLVKKRVQTMNDQHSNEPIIEEKFLKVDGTIIDVAVAAIPFNYKGKPAIHVVGRDISESKRNQNALRQSEEKFRLLAEETPNIIFIINGGKIVYVNRKVEEVLGYTRDELYSSEFNFLDTISKEQKDSAINDLKNILSGFDIGPKEYKVITKHGELLETIISSTLIHLNDDKAVLGIITDISLLKKTEKELETHRLHLEELVQSRTNELAISNKRLQNEIEHANQLTLRLSESLEKEKELSNLRSQFISAASHEFRTPLTLILSSADLLEIRQQELQDEKSLKYISKIQKSVASMTELLDEVLTINRAESGKIKFEPQSINLFNLCNEIVNSHKEYSADKHKIELDYRGGDNQIKADPKIIAGILNNLITNAIKYSPNGGEIIITVKVEDGTAVFSIKDPGIGIDPKDINHIFTPFYRGENVNAIKGNGLGLSIVQNSAILHGGSVKVFSQKGFGSVFTVEIKIDSIHKLNYDGKNINN